MLYLSNKCDILFQVIVAENMFMKNDEWDLVDSSLAREDFILDDPIVAGMVGFSDAIPMVSQDLGRIWNIYCNILRCTECL